MSSVNESLLDELIIHAVDLLRFSESIRRAVIGLLEILRSDLRIKIAEYDIAGVARDAYKRRRAEALIESAAETIKTAYGQARRRGTTLLYEVAQGEADFVKKLSKLTIGTEAAFKIPFTASDLRALATDVQVLGGPAKEYWEAQSLKTQQAFSRQIRLGVLAGEGNDAIINRVIGKATGRRLVVENSAGKPKTISEYAGGPLDLSRRDASNLIRTSIQTVSNDVLLETYRANADIMRGIKAVVTLDNRTSLICIARSGACWDLDGNPLPESPRQERFPGKPPWHFSCRTVLTPITKSWEELFDDEAGRPKVARMSTVPDDFRASMDGQVPGDITFDQWLRSKSADIQKQLLGVTRRDLWLKGKITLPELIDQSGRPISVAEWRRRLGS